MTLNPPPPMTTGAPVVSRMVRITFWNNPGCRQIGVIGILNIAHAHRHELGWNSASPRASVSSARPRTKTISLVVPIARDAHHIRTPTAGPDREDALGLEK